VSHRPEDSFTIVRLDVYKDSITAAFLIAGAGSRPIVATRGGSASCTAPVRWPRSPWRPRPSSREESSHSRHPLVTFQSQPAFEADHIGLVYAPRRPLPRPSVHSPDPASTPQTQEESWYIDPSVHLQH
jgi:hypothetical protein